MNTSLLLFSDTKYIELPINNDISFDKDLNVCTDGDYVIHCDDNACTLNNITLDSYKKIFFDKISCMLFPEEPEYYSTIGMDLIRIGHGAGNHISISDNSTEITISRICGNKIFIISGEVYINGKLSAPGEYLFEYGDCLLAGSTKITIKRDFIQCSGTEYSSKLNISVKVQRPFENFPVYKRSPRLIKREPTESVEIQQPPQKDKRKKGKLIKIILPPLLMLCITVAISLMMKRGIFIIISAAGMLMSVVFSITTFFSDRKDTKEKEAERTLGYENYLLNMRKRLFNLYEKQKESLLYHNPSITEIETLINEYSSRIYERNINDSDFLHVSAGYAGIDTSFNVKCTNSSIDFQKDELRDEMNEMASQFKAIPDMPVVIDLKKAHLGIVGEKNNIHIELKALLIQLCFFQSYHDIEIITLLENDFYSEFEWIKWFPHCKVKNINISGVIYGENQRDQVLGNIAQVLKARKQKNDEEKKDGIYIPHYIFIIDNPKLAINHSIMEYLQSERMDMGFSIIYTTNIQSNLPENIKTIILLNGSNYGTLLMNEGVLLNKSIKPHCLDDVNFENISRKLAPIIHNKGVTTQIPDSITFFELYNVKKPQEIPIKALWKQNASEKSLAVPIGVRAKNDYVYLDLHEKADGPHGLVAGTTGSGKSEILQSYILSLAVNFHPYEVGFLLIDYKGGGMANCFKKLPHLLGTITNLDGSESLRALASIKSEMSRRQRIFNESEVNNINQYTKLFRSGRVSIPMPHLMIISDEFAELKKEQPEFMTELVSTARIGRSLGVHLILATQKPTGVVDDQIWSNSRFKLALKVQDESDSREVIKTPDAARITQPGRAYLQVGNNEIYELFQSAWSGASYSENIIKQGFDNRIFLINPLGQGQLLNQDLSTLDSGNETEHTQLEVLVDQIKNEYAADGATPVEKPWLPPLGTMLVSPYTRCSIDTFVSEPDLFTQLGIVDIPENQEQTEFAHDFSKDGNLAIFGSSGFGKSLFIVNTALTLACKNSSELLHFYILDFGNSSLSQLRDLPQTADYFSFDDSEKIKKLIKMLSGEIRKRKLLFAKSNSINLKMHNSLSDAKLPAIIVFIDNYDAIKEIGSDFEDFFTKLTRDGTSIGIYSVLSASRGNSVRYALLNNIKNKVTLFMHDPLEVTAVAGRSNYKIPEIKGRALIKISSVCIMQCYLPVPFENDSDYVRQTKELINNIKLVNTAPQPDGIQMLPDILDIAQLSRLSCNTVQKVGIGLDTEDVEVQYIDINISVQLIIGAPQSGKSNLLKLICCQSDAEKIFISDSKGYDLDELKNDEKITYMSSENHLEDFISVLDKELSRKERLYIEKGSGIKARDFYSSLPTTLIIIDDADRFIDMCKPAAVQVENLLNKAVETGVCIISSTLPSRLRGYDNITKLLKDTQNGVVLGNPAEQSFFLLQPPRGYQQQIDMGFLYGRGSSKIIKIPLARI